MALLIVCDTPFDSLKAQSNISRSQVDPVALAKWRAARFGLFIHWGPVAETGQEISWSRGSKQLPIETYDNLYRTFDPEKFNADEWVSVARAAGAKYIVLTCKHHDGFCLWNSKQTDYTVTHTPFERDVVKELSEACKKEGMPFGCYYSTCDWHQPDFPLTSPGGKTVRDHSDLEKYTVYLKAQVSELLNNYGPLFTLWFDVPQCFDAKRGQGVIDLARSIQPTIVINNRTGAQGDYDTPEQRLGGFTRERPWESCMTISAHNHWAWGGDKDGVKPLKTIIRLLVACTGGDGNMLLNVGPQPDGQINTEQVNRLKEVGEWLGKYGTSIYGTRGGPYEPGNWGASTCRDRTVYLHIFRMNSDRLTLPPLAEKILKSTVLTGERAEVKQDEKGLTISIPVFNQQSIDIIVKLELAGSAVDLPPLVVANAPSERQ